MKLIIKDVVCEYDKDLTVEKLIKTIIEPKLNKVKIKFNCGIAPGVVTYVPVNKNKIFISGIENKIILKPDDARLADTMKKHGRNYLVSERLTKQQFELLIDSFNGTLDRLKISANIRLYETEDTSSFIMLRYGMENGKWPVPNSFPVGV